MRVVVAFTVVATFALGMAGPAAAGGPTIIGAGSTWSQIAIDQWRVDVNRIGLSVNYQGVGSTQGRALFAGGTVDFGASEIPFQPEDAQPHRGYSYLPDVAGGTSLMYNLQTPGGDQIRSLTLTPKNVALIFTGRITTWSDPRIAADGNPSLPNLPIRLVVRSDGSGTSAQFTRFLHETVPTIWNPFASACGVQTPPDGISFYPYGTGNCLPNAIGQRGSDGVANYVANPGLGIGAIGYIEAAYAISRRMPVVGLKNKAGNYALPTAQNVATALQHADLKPDSTQELSGVYTAPEAFAYPMSSYSYMIVPTDGLDPAKGAVLGAFINYFACAGQQSAARLGYSPLPPRLVQFTFQAERRIPGAPTPPDITPAGCANPTVTGDFKLGSSDATDNVLPYTDLGQKTYGGNGGNGSGNGTGSGTGDGTTGSNGTGSGTGDGTTGSGTGDGTGNVPGSIGGPTTGASVTETLSASALKPLQASALAQIQSLDDPGPMPLALAAIVILAAVFTPLLIRKRRLGRR